MRESFVGLRVWFLVAFGWPLLLKLPIAMLFGQGTGLLAALLGIGLLVMAGLRMQRGRAGDTRRGAVLFGVAAGLVAGLGVHLWPPVAVAMGFGAWAGARLLTDDIREEEAPPPPPEPIAVPAPLQEVEDRLAALRSRLVWGAPVLPLAPQLRRTAEALENLLRDMIPRPDRIPEARRFLAMQLDGLDRILTRLSAGAEPPASLSPLLDDIVDAADEWRARMRAAETEALDIQVKVMADRLRQEGRLDP
jgi:hypothetical protein